MKKAYLYIRVSTDEQADTGYSQRSQDEMLRRYCDINNITVVEAFFEDHSAKNFNRPQFTKLLTQLRKKRGQADLILFTKWDRFSRNAGDAYGMINTLNKLGVEPQAVEQPLNLEIPENKMMLAFYLAAPEVENDRRALNVFSGMRRAQKEGRWMGTAPIGYINKISEQGSKYIAPDPQTAHHIQWIFQQLATGNFTAESILKRARELGFNCSKNNFWNALRNPVYCGKIRMKAFKGEDEQLAHGQHEPLISEALFYEVQDFLNGKKKQQRTKVSVDDRFPMRGFLICPQCGKLLTASSSKGRKDYYHYYHCSSDCGVRFKSDMVETSFSRELSKWKPHVAVQQLYKLVLGDIHEQSGKSRKVELKQINEEMNRLQERQSKARELLLADSLEADDYKLIKKQCEERIKQLEGRLEQLSFNQADIEPMMEEALELLSNVDRRYKNESTNWKRELIGSMFPEKLEFDGIGFRTARINEAVQLIFSLGKAFGEIKMGQVKNISDLSHEVIPLVRFSNQRPGFSPHFIRDLRNLARLASKSKAA